MLVDEFENFRNTCLKHHKLYPAHFYTAPGLAWQTLLMTASDYYGHEIKHEDCKLFLDQLKLALLTNILLCEKGIKGGTTKTFAMLESTENI